MLEPTIYTRLSAGNVSTLTGGRINPIKATENQQLPCVYFACELTESNWTNTGPTGFYHYNVVVEAYDFNTTTLFPIMDAIRTALDGFTNSNVKVCKLVNMAPVDIDAGYGYQASFEVWANV